MVSKINLATAVFALCAAVSWLDASSTLAQTTRIVPWNDGNFDITSASTNAYHPEPVIFVHGITDSRLRWKNIISYLSITQGWFQAYHYISNQVAQAKESANPPAEDYTLSELPSGETNQWIDIEQPYLHTFNYGRHAKVGPAPPLPLNTFAVPPSVSTNLSYVKVSRQSHDPVEWNSWQAPANDYLQSRVTLNARVSQIRQAYTIGMNQPNVILIGHSLGGLIVTDYLLTKNQNLGSDPYVPVRRAITLNTLLWGSPIANVLANLNNIRYFNPVLKYGGKLFEAFSTLTAPARAVWIQNNLGATRYLTVDLPNALAVDNMPTINAAHAFYNGNPFASKLRGSPMPTTTEFVTSGSHDPNQPRYVWAVVGKTNLYQDLKVAFDGDGAVPLNSMAGYNGNGTPVFANLSPVDIRGYANNNTNWIVDHSHAPDQMGIYPLLLDGVSYASGSRPDRAGNWSGFQKEYTNSPIQNASGTTFTHTDEPGIDSEWSTLLRNRVGGNPLVIPSFSTWGWTWSGSQWQWQKQSVTDETQFANYQIIGGTGSGSIRYLGRVGAKNQNPYPVYAYGTNSSVSAGNEYLPASLSLQVSNAFTSIAVASTAASLPSATQIVNQCLVQLDTNGVLQYQYGYIDVPVSGPIATNTNSFVAVQGYNRAGLLIPQSEFAFNVPVDSKTVVAILSKINEAEAFTNSCPIPCCGPTHWTATGVSEWLTVTNAPIPLNFYPVYNPTAGSFSYDPWTYQDYDDWTYDIVNKTITFTNLNTAPSQVLIDLYDGVYLGCKEPFTANYGGTTNFTVPALTDDSLVGVPVTESWLSNVREALEQVIPQYQDTTSSACLSWTKESVIKQADPAHVQTNWTPIVNGLLLPQHFQELKAVTDLLTTEFVLSPQSNATVTLSQPCYVVQSNTFTFAGTDCYINWIWYWTGWNQWGGSSTPYLEVMYCSVTGNWYAHILDGYGEGYSGTIAHPCYDMGGLDYWQQLTYGVDITCDGGQLHGTFTLPAVNGGACSGTATVQLP